MSHHTGHFGSTEVTILPGDVLPNQIQVMLPLRPAESPFPFTVVVAKVSVHAITALLGSLLQGDDVGTFPRLRRQREGQVT